MLSLHSGVVGEEMQLVFECTALASLRSWYPRLFTVSTDPIRISASMVIMREVNFRPA